jgi:hypothetical protein
MVLPFCLETKEASRMAEQCPLAHVYRLALLGRWRKEDLSLERPVSSERAASFEAAFPDCERPEWVESGRPK